MNIRVHYILIVALLTCIGISQPPAYAQAPAWSVYFSPKGGCTDAIIQELDKAKKSVLAQAYSFTSSRACLALAMTRWKMAPRRAFSLPLSGDRDVGSKATFPVVNYEGLCRKVGTLVHKGCEGGRP